MYYEITPKGWAADFIDAYWYYGNTSLDTECSLVLPDGCTDIIFSRFEDHCESHVIGCMTSPLQISLQSHISKYGIRIKAGYAKCFLPFPLSELTNKQYRLDEILRKDFSSIISNSFILEPEMVFNLLETSLHNILFESNINHTICEAVHLIKSYKGTLSISSLTDELNISQRQLERIFADNVGVSPKMFSRILRFQYVSQIIKEQKNSSILSIALEAGYWDQSHFCKEFKEFSGGNFKD